MYINSCNIKNISKNIPQRHYVTKSIDNQLLGLGIDNRTTHIRGNILVGFKGRARWRNRGHLTKRDK